MLTTHAHLVPCLRKSEVIFYSPPSYTTMTWTAATLLSSVHRSHVFQTSFVQSLKYLQMVVRKLQYFGWCLRPSRKKEAKFRCIQFSELLCV
jgi:hypothetical protein